MWGCLKGLFFTFGGLFLLLLIVVGGGWWYLGTASFAGLIQLRIAKTLEARLGRKVYIHDVVFYRTHPTRVVINDLRIANAPGAVNPYFATVQQVEIAGGIESFWGRNLNVSHVDIRNPHLYFEVFPAGSQLVHNFPHWNSGPQSKYEIVHVDLNTLFIRGGAFDFLDRRHNLAVTTSNISSDIKVTLKQGLYAGTMSSPLLRVRIQDYVPFDLDLRGGFRYTPGALELSSIALRGRDMQLFVAGRIDPLTDAVYNLHLTSQLGLNRVREIFKVNKVLDGVVTLDTNLRGKAGTFRMQGGWISNKISADVYDLASLKGNLDLTDTRAIVDVATAKFGGGTIGAHYTLPGFNEPYPQTVDLRYNGVSLEKLLGDWGIKNTGLRGGATGSLAFHWNKDKVLEGGGEGHASLAALPAEGSGAKYPIVLRGGEAQFAIDNGVVKFASASLITDNSRIDFSGSLRIEDVGTDMDVKIHSTDFSELDRIAYNFAHSAGKEKFALLGLGGRGDITAHLKGPIKSPQLVAHIDSTGTKFNNQILGDGAMDLKYDGNASVMTFEHAQFALNGGRITMTGTMTFPDRGPSPKFDLALEAHDYPVESAIKVVDLPFKGINGLATGKLLVTGTPEEGKATFVDLNMTKQKTAELRLNGTVAWHPGKGTSTFDLDIAARQFPVADIVAFLDLGTLPVTGELTGTLHLEGPKSKLEGAGSVAVRKGAIFGEPVDVATADIVFTQGRIKASNVNIAAPAGKITAEAEMNLDTNQFSYIVKTSSIDLSKLEILKSLQGLLGGKVTIQSSGGGTLDQPELVVEATLNDATIRGLALPPGSAPPTIYFAIRNGQLIVKGSIADILTIDGSGTVGKDLALDGNVRITAPDIAKLVALSPNTASLPASGNFIVDLKLGGKLSPIEALRIDGTVPQLSLKLSDHEFTPARPLKFGLRGGRIVFDDFEIQHPGTSFTVSGFAEVTGQKILGIDLKGGIEASLLQLFVKDLRADGNIVVNAGIAGTMSNPRITGSAEVQAASFRFAGFPQIIDHVTGTLVFKSDRIEIDSLRATIGGGNVIAGGFIGVNGIVPTSARLTLHGTDVAIRYYEGLTVDGNFDLVISGDTERFVVTGDINVNRALYSKDIDFGAAVLNAVLSRRSVTPIVAANWQDRVSLRLQVNAPNTLAVRNNIADVTGSADLYVTGTLANPSVIGSVTLNEGGKVRLQNVDYTVTRGTINFQNPFRIDPYFDVTIEGRVSGGGFSELESGPIDVTVNLVGTLDRFTPSITSDPPASDITLFSLLGFGGLTSMRSGTTATAGANPFNQGMLLSSLSSLIGNKILPFVDSFTYDPGNLDTTDDPGPKVTLERRISNEVRVLIIYNLNTAHSRALLEWQVNPDWTLRLTNDEVRREYRAEARFRRRYEGHWSWGGSREKEVTLFASMGNVAAPPKVEEITVPPPSDAPIVTKIDYRADARFDTKLLENYVALKVGQPMSLRNTQASIKSLFATGDFRDVRVESTPSEGGVDVTIVLSLNYRVASLTFEGLHGKERERAEREMSVHDGDVLSLNAVDRSSTAVQQYLNRVGYFEATVDPETQFERSLSRATVIMHVTTGPRAQIRNVVIEGNTAPFPAAELIAQMKRGPGHTFRLYDARGDADRMERFMIRREYRKADVRFVSNVYDPATKSVTLNYTATSGPIVKVAVAGVPEHDVRREIPFDRNQAFSEDVVDTAADDIVTAYQSRGFFNAAVDTEEHLDPATNVFTITFHVTPGERFHLDGVTFSGNQKIDDKQLRNVVQTAPSGGVKALLATLFRRSTSPTRQQLSTDRDAIESYYRLNGFSEATVSTPVVNTDAATGSMTVDFPIKEGPQTIVTDVTIEGMQQARAEQLPKFDLRPGTPLNPQLLRNDLLNIQTFYADRGNAEVQVTPRPVLSADKTTAKLTYVIAEGPQIKVDRVVVRGNTYTHTNVIERKAGLDKGDPFSYTRLLEAQQNLYRLGIFQRVDIQPEQAGTSVADRNVTIQVEEGKDLAVSGSLGVSKQTGLPFSLLGSASIAHRNLFGTGRYLGFETIFSRGQRHEFFLTEREPFIGPWDIPLQFNLFQSDQHRPHAHIRQRGGSVEASKVAGLQTRWSVRYEYRIGTCLENPEDNQDLCRQAEQALIPGVDRAITNIAISSITPTFFWDRRDDPIDPHRGFLTSASIEYAFPIAAATADFTKEYAQASYYLPLTDRTVFAVSGRAGLIQPRNNAIVPFTEKFTSGGEASHRAFQLDLLGDLCPPGSKDCSDFTLIRLLDQDKNPTDQIAPIGGNGLFVANIEYRFPIFATVGGAVFTDVGNVFSRSTIHFNNLRYGIGTGIRYLSPVGPLRFDFGYKLRHRSYEKPYAYFITLGYAF